VGRARGDPALTELREVWRPRALVLMGASKPAKEDVLRLRLEDKLAALQAGWSVPPPPHSDAAGPPTPATSSLAPPTCVASCAPMSRPPDLAERVAEFIAEHQLLEPGQPLLALVSGGADSLCLWGVTRELGHPVEALHVEHGLRGSRGLDDAAYCAALGASVVPVDLEPGGNPRRARPLRAARELADGRPIATGHAQRPGRDGRLRLARRPARARSAQCGRLRTGGAAALCVSAAETRACGGAGTRAARRHQRRPPRSAAT
jgi:hypothetical protein